MLPTRLFDPFRLTPLGAHTKKFGSVVPAAAVRIHISLALKEHNAMNVLSLSIIPAILIVALFVITASVKILREYERAVVFTLGRFQKVKGPGLVLLIPFVQEMVRVDLRIQAIEIPSQDVISHDNVSMKVDAVLYFNVVNPERAIIQVQNYLPATNMLAQTTLRAVLGQHELTKCCLNERSSALTSRASWTPRPKPGGSK